MLTLATLIAIAAWCGFPTNTYSSKQVDQCRTEIWDCLKHNSRDSQCFITKKLGE